MPVPTGADEVAYTVKVGVSEETNDWGVTIDITPQLDTWGEATSPALQHVHDAIEAGMEAIMAHLATQYPSYDVEAFRTYRGEIQGAAWPGS